MAGKPAAQWPAHSPAASVQKHAVDEPPYAMEQGRYCCAASAEKAANAEGTHPG